MAARSRWTRRSECGGAPDLVLLVAVMAILVGGSWAASYYLVRWATGRDPGVLEWIGTYAALFAASVWLLTGRLSVAVYTLLDRVSTWVKREP